MLKTKIFLAATMNAANTGGSDFGVNIQNWMSRQVSAIALVVMACILIPVMIKRKWALLITTLFGGAVALFFINSPETLINLGRVVYNIVFGGA